MPQNCLHSYCRFAIVSLCVITALMVLSKEYDDGSLFGQRRYHDFLLRRKLSLPTQDSNELPPPYEIDYGLERNCTRHTGCNSDQEMVWRSKEEYEYEYSLLVCGSTTLCSTEPKLVPANELHPVRCCSNVPLEGFKNDFCSDVWADSDDVGCKRENFTSAVEICAANNARLCTQSELERDCTKKAGCDFSNKMVWSKEVPEDLVVCGSTSRCSEQPKLVPQSMSIILSVVVLMFY